MSRKAEEIIESIQSPIRRCEFCDKNCYLLSDKTIKIYRKDIREIAKTFNWFLDSDKYKPLRPYWVEMVFCSKKCQDSYTLNSLFKQGD